MNPDSSCKEPRVSFTFRKLCAEQAAKSKPRAPPIKRPGEFKETPRPITQPKSSHHKVLLLTDSILQGSPEHVFNRIPSHRCVKQRCKQLTEIFKWEDDFRHSSFVVISGGINDLSCYGHTSDSLSSAIVSELRRCCERNPNTWFVFNSLLDSSHPWLNVQVDSFNRAIFELSSQVYNLVFLDSHDLIVKKGLGKANRFDVLQREDPRGVQITFAARRIITDHLVPGLQWMGYRSGLCATDVADSSWRWPVREGLLKQFPTVVSFNRR